MKELLLQAVLDAGTCGITPPALCRWLIALTGGPVEGATGNARKFYHIPCPDVLEIWFQDTLSQQAENVICYSRISFRPLLPASAATSSTATDCRIAVEVLPPEQIYTSIPLSEMGLVGASPPFGGCRRVGGAARFAQSRAHGKTEPCVCRAHSCFDCPVGSLFPYGTAGGGFCRPL